jgi:hypothetical protein
MVALLAADGAAGRTRFAAGQIRGTAIGAEAAGLRRIAAGQTSVAAAGIQLLRCLGRNGGAASLGFRAAGLLSGAAASFEAACLRGIAAVRSWSAARRLGDADEAALLRRIATYGAGAATIGADGGPGIHAGNGAKGQDNDCGEFLKHDSIL